MLSIRYTTLLASKETAKADNGPAGRVVPPVEHPAELRPQPSLPGGEGGHGDLASASPSPSVNGDSGGGGGGEGDGGGGSGAEDQEEQGCFGEVEEDRGGPGLHFGQPSWGAASFFKNKNRNASLCIFPCLPFSGK